MYDCSGQKPSDILVHKSTIPQIPQSHMQLQMISHLQLIGNKQREDRNRGYAGAQRTEMEKKEERKSKKNKIGAREQNSPIVHFNYSQVAVSVSCAAQCLSAAGEVKVTETVVCLHVWNTDGYRASSQPTGSMLTTLSLSLSLLHTHSHMLSVIFHAQYR